MRTVVLRTAAIAAAVMLAVTASATLIGPGDLPGWSGQVGVGWQFDYGPDNDANDMTVSLISDWERFIGPVAPEWTYDEGRENPSGDYGQWSVVVGNVPDIDQYKRLWMSFVYDFHDPLEAFWEIQGNPMDGIELVGGPVHEVLDAVGDPIGDNGANPAYLRTTVEYRLWPNPISEQIWIGFDNHSPVGGPHLREVYLKTECVPEPATMTLLGIGLAGFALKRFRSRKRG